MPMYAPDATPPIGCICSSGWRDATSRNAAASGFVDVDGFLGGKNHRVMDLAQKRWSCWAMCCRRLMIKVSIAGFTNTHEATLPSLQGLFRSVFDGVSAAAEPTALRIHKDWSGAAACHVRAWQSRGEKRLLCSSATENRLITIAMKAATESLTVGKTIRERRQGEGMFVRACSRLMVGPKPIWPRCFGGPTVTSAVASAKAVTMTALYTQLAG